MGLNKAEVFRGGDSQNVPGYLQPTKDGKLIPLDARPFDNQQFDAIYPFGFSRSRLIDTVPPKERITHNTERVIYVGFSDPDVSVAMKEITRINATHLEDPETTVFFPPLNGGALIKAFFQQLGLITDPERQVADFELKRMLRTNGELMVGVREHRYPEGQFKTGVVLDDCLASDVSASTTIDLMLRHYPTVENILVVTSAATQRGVELLLKEWNDVDLRVTAATPVFAMTWNFYLLRTKEEEGFEFLIPPLPLYVGDMGQWAVPLSPEYNDKAPWNQNRNQ